jgi:hypothetical protein
MFKYALVEKKEVDLDKLLEDLKTKSDFVNWGVQIFGSLEYAFIVDCVEKQIEEIKKKTPMLLNGEDTISHD